MPPRRRGAEFFEELGLLAEQNVSNPYRELGIEPGFARRLLDEDKTGARLQTYADGVYKTLARLYHPDVGPGANRERFEEVHAATERIKNAGSGALRRWSKAESGGAAGPTKQQELRDQVAARAVELVRMNMELGGNPLHFSQLRWAQGVLLRQDGKVLLARASAHGTQVLKGEKVASVGGAAKLLGDTTQAIDFQQFMRRHDFFGLRPGTQTALYLDEAGRASILDAGLGFVMDITDPIAAYRGLRKKAVRKLETAVDASMWAGSLNPMLAFTQVPSPSDHDLPGVDFTYFPRVAARTKASLVSMVSNVYADVAGSIADVDYFRAVRFDRRVGVTALAGSGTVAHFGMASIPVSQLVEKLVGYTPLLAPNNALLLFDSENRTPVVTDARVVGVIGNGAQVTRAEMRDS